MVIGALTLCALLYFMIDLIAAQMNVQWIQIREFRLDEFELGYNAAEKKLKTICSFDVDLCRATR